MDEIERAKAQLIFKEPFFGSLATRVQIRESSKIDTYQISGDTLEVNREFIKKLSIDEISSILANSALYQALFHSKRGEGKVNSIWQSASSFAINDILVQNGFVLPPLAKYKRAFEGMYAEEIYSILLESLEDFEELEEVKESRVIDDFDYNIAFEELIKKFETTGELPRGVERVIKGRDKSSKIKWKILLKRYINSYAKSDYRAFPSSKKHLWRGVSLPSIRSFELKIAVAIDTSASIDDRARRTFLSEVEKILSTFREYKILLIEADSKVQRVTTLLPLMGLKRSLKGGGGTDFRPVFKYLNSRARDFQFLIYFTDGRGTFPKSQGSMATLWVLTQDIEVPFGEKVVIDLSQK